MLFFRQLLAVCFFVGALYFCYHFLLFQQHWSYLLAAVFSFLLAYWIWPNKKRRQSEQDHWLIDWLEIIIEFPIDLTVNLARLILRIFRNTDVGMD